jgi:hypothetical protein
LDGSHRSHAWWPVGALIGTDMTDGGRGGCTFVVDPDRVLDPGERLCVGVN